jgi:ABC-type glycerol-3-phosphate transport system substrate-binding protein
MRRLNRKAITTMQAAIIAVIIIIAVVAAAYYYTTLPEEENGNGEPEEVTVNLVGWTYGPEIVQGLIDEFEELNPTITIEWKHWPSSEYYEKVVPIFTASPNDADVAYCDWGYLPAFVEAGWVTDIEDMTDIATIKADLIGSAREGMSYDGKLYGLPYFSGTFIACYNQRIMNESGWGVDPPTTIIEYQNCLQMIKDSGLLDYPYTDNLDYTWYGASVTWIQWASIIGGKDHRLFSEAYEPNFLEAGTPGYKALEFLNTLYEEELLNPASFEASSFNAMEAIQAGTSAFQMKADTHKLIFMNDASVSHEAGNCFALPNFQTGTVLTRTAMYTMTKNCKDNKPAAVYEAAQKFLRFLGGQSSGKEWALAKGLGFGWEPLLEDPTILSNWGHWMNLTDYESILEDAVDITTFCPTFTAEWFPEWRMPVVGWVQQAIKGEITVDTALQNIADLTEELKTGS